MELGQEWRQSCLDNPQNGRRSTNPKVSPPSLSITHSACRSDDVVGCEWLEVEGFSANQKMFLMSEGGGGEGGGREGGRGGGGGLIRVLFPLHDVARAPHVAY